MEQLARVFNYGEIQVRMVLVDGEPWFVAKDICDVLEISNNRDALSRLDHDEKGVVSTDTLGGRQDLTAVNEPGLYSLILGSRKPEAREFKRWITHDVLPSIRKNGMYATEELLDDPELLLKTVTRLHEERQARLAAEAQLTEQAPKVEAFDTFLTAEGTFTIDDVAKSLGQKPSILRQFLRDRKVLRQNGLPMQRYLPRYFVVRHFVYYVGLTACTKPYTHVTPEGVEFIRRLLNQESAVEPVANVGAPILTLNLRINA